MQACSAHRGIEPPQTVLRGPAARLERETRLRGIAALRRPGKETAACLGIVPCTAAMKGVRCARDLNTPGYRLHPLKGDMQGFWSIRASANWRITFRFEAGDVYDVDLTDYH